ncbi:peptidoglycan DD-metalloendopeptidase family protein [Streptomyces sp. O3]
MNETKRALLCAVLFVVLGAALVAAGTGGRVGSGVGVGMGMGVGVGVVGAAVAAEDEERVQSAREQPAEARPGGERPGGERPGGERPGGERPGGERGRPGGRRGWPVGERPAVLRGWEPPASPYGPGHRGVDLAGSPGAAVRAVAAGRVAFAGRVAGRPVVSIELAGTGEPPLRTTYEPVRAQVEKGDAVEAGEVVGVLSREAAHCAPTCLHWGLRRAHRYLDPLSLLPPRGPSRLLPVFGVPEPPAVGEGPDVSPVPRAARATPPRR